MDCRPAFTALAASALLLIPVANGAFAPKSATTSLHCVSAGRPAAAFVQKKYSSTGITATTESAPCDAPLETKAAVPDFVSKSDSAEVLRSVLVTGANGNLVPLGDSMGDGRSVVVFLRHLG